MRPKEHHLGTVFKTADEFRKSFLSSGTRAIDNLLGGGFETGLAHHIFGESKLLCKTFDRIVNNRGKKTEKQMIVLDCEEIDKAEQEKVAEKRYIILRPVSFNHACEIIERHLPKAIERVPTELIVVRGLLERLQRGQKGHRTRLDNTLLSLRRLCFQRDIVSVLLSTQSNVSPYIPNFIKEILGYFQVHINISDAGSYSKFVLAKHPRYPVRSVVCPRHLEGETETFSLRRKE